MDVTGYKTDIWLVKTVGALLIPIAACLYSHLFIETNHTPALILGAFTAAAFISIDFHYALNDVISDIYLADGLLELLFLAGRILRSPESAQTKYLITVTTRGGTERILFYNTTERINFHNCCQTNYSYHE